MKLQTCRKIPLDPVKRSDDGICFEYHFPQSPHIKWMFFGIYEYATSVVMKKFLHTGDTFFDIGANIGYFSMKGMHCVGKSGEVHSFEPVPQCMESLNRLYQLNPGYHLVINPVGLGEKEELRDLVLNTDNIGGSTVVKNLLPDSITGGTIPVQIRRLDRYMVENSVNHIHLMKIDVEGFEFPVLKGLSAYFDGTDQRPPIICEVTPEAYPLLGTSLHDFARLMQDFGYRSFLVANPQKEIDLADLSYQTDILFRAKIP